MPSKPFAESVAKVAETSGLKPTQVHRVIKALAEEMKACLVKGLTFRMGNFGSFKISQLSARKMRNPQTGGTIDVPARKRARFKGGRLLNEALNEAPSKPKKKAPPIKKGKGKSKSAPPKEEPEKKDIEEDLGELEFDEEL